MGTAADAFFTRLSDAQDFMTELAKLGHEPSLSQTAMGFYQVTWIIKDEKF